MQWKSCIMGARRRLFDAAGGRCGGACPQQQHPREDGGAVGSIEGVGGSVADAPAVDDLQQVEHVDDAVGVHITLAGWCAVIA